MNTGLILLFVFAILAVIVIVAGFLIWGMVTMRRGEQKKFIEQNMHEQKRREAIRTHGITSPAIIVAAKNGFVSRKNYQGMLVTFEVDVQPEGQPQFRATFKDWIPAGASYQTFGERSEDVGRKIWVTYNPNDVSQMLFEDYHSDELVKRFDFNKIEKRDKVIRETGDEATAMILEVEPLDIATGVEQDVFKRTALRLKLEVIPKNGESFQAEAQGMFVNSSLHKYAVGKKVYVKFNSQEKTQVALIGAVEQ